MSIPWQIDADIWMELEQVERWHQKSLVKPRKEIFEVKRSVKQMQYELTPNAPTENLSSSG